MVVAMNRLCQKEEQECDEYRAREVRECEAVRDSIMRTERRGQQGTPMTLVRAGEKLGCSGMVAPSMEKTSRASRLKAVPMKAFSSARVPALLENLGSDVSRRPVAAS